MNLEGKVFKYGDDVNTDVIIPARYLNATSASELAAHCMEDIDKGFAKRVKKNDIIVGGANFGSGSSREHAPLSIKASGIQIVIAKSFARIFYRNSLNIGLNILENSQIADETENGDILEIDYEKSLIVNKAKNKNYKIKGFDGFIKTLVEAGGLVEAVLQKKL